jgi:hypothetical protein
MTAIVIDMSSYRRESPRPEELAREYVHQQLNGTVTDTVLAQAQARAERGVRGGRRVDEAVYTAVAWARFAVQPQSGSR